MSSCERRLIAWFLSFGKGIRVAVQELATPVAHQQWCIGGAPVAEPGRRNAAGARGAAHASGFFEYRRFTAARPGAPASNNETEILSIRACFRPHVERRRDQRAGVGATGTGKDLL